MGGKELREEALDKGLESGLGFYKERKRDGGAGCSPGPEQDMHFEMGMDLRPK